METATKNTSLLARLFSGQQAIGPLVVLRIAFGLMMLYGTLRFFWLGWIDNHYIQPLMHFKYAGFEWVEPLSASGMYTVHAVMALAALFVALGLFYRVSALAFFLTFTYTELIDLTYYLNHYYFASIVALLLCLVPANAAFSLDVRLGLQRRFTHVPAWCINIFKLQVAIVYFYAGIAKINHDWLIEAMPLRIWLPANDELFLLGPLFRYTATAYAFSWMGMLYDIFIAFFLMWGRGRAIAYLAVIFFHSITGMLFQIGIFPLVMMAMSLIFLPASTWKNLGNRLGFARRYIVEQTYRYRPVGQMALNGFLVLFVAFQLLYPWRYVAYPGNLFWTEEGYRFSWRVMLMEKAGTALFYVKDNATGHEGIVDNHDFINTHQEKQMAMQPDMILQYAHWLKQYYRQQGLADPSVRAEVWVTLNGRPSQLYFDPKLDLTTLSPRQPYTWLASYEK